MSSPFDDRPRTALMILEIHLRQVDLQIGEHVRRRNGQQEDLQETERGMKLLQEERAEIIRALETDRIYPRTSETNEKISPEAVPAYPTGRPSLGPEERSHDLPEKNYPASAEAACEMSEKGCPDNDPPKTPYRAACWSTNEKAAYELGRQDMAEELGRIAVEEMRRQPKTPHPQPGNLIHDRVLVCPWCNGQIKVGRF